MKFNHLILITILCMSSFSQSYAKSSFNEVKDVLYSEQIPIPNENSIRELKIYQSRKLPQYKMNMATVFALGSKALEQSAQRTLTNRSDYLDRLPKLLHPNGVCVLGEWRMFNNTKYSGAFSANFKSLFIGRISVAMQETKTGHDRGFGFAGKIFPSIDPNNIVDTENFFSVDNLMGTKIDKFLDTATTNEPELGFDISKLPFALRLAWTLQGADSKPGFRPINNLSRIGLGEADYGFSPKWIRITSNHMTKKNIEADFRNEVLRAVKENKILVFDVSVSSKTSDPKDFNHWEHIGEIRISDALVSYGCDKRLHFSHPKIEN